MMKNLDTVWVAVRIQRGFVTRINAYSDERNARRKERRWRSKMNADYDETGVMEVVLPAALKRSS